MPQLTKDDYAIAAQKAQDFILMLQFVFQVQNSPSCLSYLNAIASCKPISRDARDSLGEKLIHIEGILNYFHSVPTPHTRSNNPYPCERCSSKHLKCTVVKTKDGSYLCRQCQRKGHPCCKPKVIDTTGPFATQQIPDPQDYGFQAQGWGILNPNPVPVNTQSTINNINTSFTTFPSNNSMHTHTHNAFQSSVQSNEISQIVPEGTNRRSFYPFSNVIDETGYNSEMTGHSGRQAFFGDTHDSSCQNAPSSSTMLNRFHS